MEAFERANLIDKSVKFNLQQVTEVYE